MVSRLASVQEMLLEEETILDITRSHEDTLDWLYKKGLLQKEPTCPKCWQKEMKVERDSSKADLQRFRCRIRLCRGTASIRMGSFFEDSKLTLIEYTRIIFHYFVKDMPRSQVIKELNVNKNTVTEIYASLRFLISEHSKIGEMAYQLGEVISDFEDNEFGIEIDESLFSHYNGSQVWVFGIYDRRTSDARVFVVENRSADILIPIIQDNIVPGARIYSDGWASYSNLSELGYDHRVVIHENGFGKGFFTTNHVESLWSQLKSLTNQPKGCVKAMSENWKEVIQHHLDVGIWKRRHRRENLVEELCFILRGFYT